MKSLQRRYKTSVFDTTKRNKRKGEEEDDETVQLGGKKLNGVDKEKHNNTHIGAITPMTLGILSKKLHHGSFNVH